MPKWRNPVRAGFKLGSSMRKRKGSAPDASLETAIRQNKVTVRMGDARGRAALQRMAEQELESQKPKRRR